MVAHVRDGAHDPVLDRPEGDVEGGVQDVVPDRDLAVTQPADDEVDEVRRRCHVRDGIRTRETPPPLVDILP